VLILQIKQAQCALADGRLDEAFEIANCAAVRQDRRGQELIGQLACALADRGESHLAAGRLAGALADCNKAEKLAGNLSAIAQLRAAICQVGNEKRHQDQQQGAKLAKAREHIDNGQLSAGEQILNEIGGDGGSADMLLAEAAGRRAELDAAVRRVQEAMDRGDMEEAINTMVRAGAARVQNKKLADLAGQIRTLAVQRIRDAVNSGRIDRGQTIWQIMAPLANESPELQGMDRIIGQFRKAHKYIESGQLRSAAVVLRQLKTILPDADWLDKAVDDAEQAAGGLETLRSGPLAWVIPVDGESSGGNKTGLNEHEKLSTNKGSRDRGSSKQIAGEYPAGEALPGRFVIQVDGVGSFLVVRKRQVTIGPISSSGQADIGLVADPNLPMASIERSDEDYFIRSGKSLTVNNKPVTEKLLADGDSIALSARCRLKFYLPNAASTTARLAFSGAKLPRLDIRQAILLDREIIVGPSSSAHIRADRCSESLVLFLQDGQLLCRTNETINVDGRVQDRRIGLPMGKSVKIGEISMVLVEM
jgi:hypothetical protein